MESKYLDQIQFFLPVHELLERVWFSHVIEFQIGACLAVYSLVPNTKYRTSLFTSVKERSFRISLISAKNNKRLAPDCSTAFFFPCSTDPSRNKKRWFCRARRNFLCKRDCVFTCLRQFPQAFAATVTREEHRFWSKPNVLKISTGERQSGL